MRGFVKVDYGDGSFLVSLPFEENWRIEDIARRWQPNTRRWIVPVGWRSAEHLMKVIHGKYWSDEAAAAASDAIAERPVVKVQAVDVLKHVFKTKPMAHQVEAYEKAYNQDQYALFFEQGLGKTKTAIDLNSMWYLDELIDTVVTFCPVSIRLVWEKEFATHCSVPYHLQLMSSKGIGKWKTGVLRVLIVGIESLSQGNTFKTLSALAPSLGRIAMNLDESSRAKNHKAIRTQNLTTFSALCSKRLILTGTPVTQGIQDLYSQFQILNPATLDLRSYYAFRNRYCIEEPIRGAPKGVTKIIGYRNVRELMELIEPWSLRKEKADCLDLPEKVYQTRYVEMTAHQREIYKTMKKHMVAQIQVKLDEVKGDAHKTLNVKAKMMLEAYLRLQQIAGGFLPELDKDGKTIAVHPIPGNNPKLNELKEFMDENPHPVVIMCRFRSELAAIAKILGDTRKVVQFHGGMNEDEKKESERAFMAGEADVFLSSLQAGSYGLTLTAASTMIYYSMGFSLEEFLQSQDRIHRIGQTKGCNYVSIAAADSIDQDVVDAITQKKSIADMVNERIKTRRSLDDLL